MSGWLLLLTVVLLLVNGFFVAMEFALIAARRSRIETLANDGNRRAVAALRSIKELSLMLAGAQLGITMASLGLGAIAEPAIARLLESGIETFAELPSGLLHSISFVIALTIIVFFHMVVGEMAPKNIAIARPEESALWMAFPIRVYGNLFRPFIKALNAIANGVLRLLGVAPQDELLTVHTAQELRVMVQESAKGGVLQEFETHLLSGAASFGEKDAADAMVPRTEMIALPLEITAAEVEAKVVESGHTRFPIYIETPDRVVGFFHAKDLLKIAASQRNKRIPRRLIRPLLVVPESRKLHPLLFDMRRERRHFALVVDEHGGTAGIVTLEDLLEELVGEILDEYDEGEAGIERLSDRRFLVPGTLRIDEVSELLDAHLPEGDYETIAGFLMDRLGRVPVRRDVVTHGDWSLQVRRMYRRRVVQVLIEPSPGSGPVRPPVAG
jgi:CBS domain containing-hemolysin-like protein